MAHARLFFPARLLGRGVTFMNFAFIGGAGVVQWLSGRFVQAGAGCRHAADAASAGSISPSAPRSSLPPRSIPFAPARPASRTSRQRASADPSGPGELALPRRPRLDRERVQAAREGPAEEPR